LSLTAASFLQASQGCQNEHSDGPYGENLWWSSAAQYNSDPEDWMGSWYDEEVGNYNYDDPGASRGMIGHFTQVRS
jgi:hypothetical protein